MVGNRLLYWDTLKGILIVLVVLGHCGTAVGQNLISLIYAFHMPLFILVSGYFSKKSDVMNWGGYKRLIIIYFVFDVMYLSLDISAGYYSIQRILSPSFALWYILSLIYWRLILQFIPSSMLEKKKIVLIAVFCVSILVGFIPIGTELSFQRTFVFFPFFMLGYYMKQACLIEKVRKWNKILAILTIIALSVIAFVYLPTFYGNSPYGVDFIHPLITRLLHLIIAISLCLSILVVVPEKMRLVTQLGRYTLLIYLLHPPIVKTLKVILIKMNYELDLIASLFITLISISIIYAIRNFRLFKYLQ